jgi:hypothetical protein
MAIAISDLPSALQAKITGAASIEQSLFVLFQVMQQYENTPASNPDNLNRISVVIADNGTAACTFNTPTTKDISSGVFESQAVSYLVGE